MRLTLRSRRAVTTVEFALIAPVLVLLLFGIIIGGVGIYRYQAVANLAREGARYASVRGSTYASKTGKDAATAKDVYDDVIEPGAVPFDRSRLSYAVTWNPDNKQKSTVTVTVTYQWIPEAFLGGIRLSSSSTAEIAY